MLARYQASEVDDWRDAQPGKILHESREGEMTRCGEVPFGPYYGSVDATPLWLILLSETFNWTADEALAREMLPHAYRALDWIDNYGDIDGDGFVEYLRRSPRGLINQGWKDSWDANIHRDGTHCGSRPLRSVKCRDTSTMPSTAWHRCSACLATTSARRSAVARPMSLRGALTRPSGVPSAASTPWPWMRTRSRLEVVSSNPGHLLWSRIINRERARIVTQRLMQDDMFSGWGWRTMSQQEQVFNPLSYHRGSVWPHDNSLIAHGMALNEFREPALRILSALFQAAMEFRDYRLAGALLRGAAPSVRRAGALSCLLLSASVGLRMFHLPDSHFGLGIRPSAHRKELNIINPQLPDWLGICTSAILKIGNSRVGLDFTRRDHRTFCNVVDISGDKLLVNVAFRH